MWSCSSPSGMLDLICPKCHHKVRKNGNEYVCSGCGHIYPVHDGIPSFVTSSAKLDSFDKERFKSLYEMEQRHFWHVGRKEIIYALLQKLYAENLSSISMIEIGCGNGSVLQFLRSKGINIEGADLFMEALRFCRRRGDAPLYQVDALKSPFPDGHYDLVGLFDVIEHLDDDEAVLQEASRICKNRGRIIVTVPANKWLWSYFDVASRHKRRYSKTELRNKLQNAGFIVEKISFFVSFLLPVFAMYRIIGNMRSTGTDVSSSSKSEVRTIPFVNGIFLSTLRLERLLIRYVNLPLGASLVAIARKA